MYPVAVADLPHVLPECIDFLRQATGETAGKAVNCGDEILDDVLIALADGFYTLWLEPGKFAAVVEIRNFPRQRVATIVYCGGSDLDCIKGCFEHGRQWCREHDVQVLRVYGREGWERLLGLERIGVVLQTRVTHG